MQPRIHHDGDGRAMNILGNPMLEKAGSEDLGGAAAVFVSTVMPRMGPPAHFHRLTDEFFYVLEGEIDVWIDGRHLTLTPGMSATLPRGLVHRFDNLGERPAKVLTVVTPGDGALFFEDIDREQPQLPGELHKLIAIVGRHDIEMVEGAG
jgi:mannose-6-phosphate isomerase-like protein (cupin superfamily)